MDDLEQAGMIGLMKAADRFDESLGYKFSTYAAWWVRHVIERLIEDEACTVRTPVHLQQRRRKAGEPCRAHVSSLDRNTAHRHGTIGSDEGCAHLDLLASPEPEDEPDATPRTTIEELIASTPSLTDAEAFVLRERSRASERTLKAIGEDLGRSRERVRQLEMSAIAKVRGAHGLQIDDVISQSHARYRAGISRGARRARRARAPGRPRAE